MNTRKKKESKRKQCQKRANCLGRLYYKNNESKNKALFYGLA